MKQFIIIAQLVICPLLFAKEPVPPKLKCNITKSDEIKQQTLAKEKGDFILNSFIALSDWIHSKKVAPDDLIVKFSSLCAEERFKIGDSILFVNQLTGATEKGKLLRIDNELVNSDEYKVEAGIASRESKFNPKVQYPPKFVAFFNFNEQNNKFCKIERNFKQDSALKNAVEKYRDHEASAEKRRYMNVDSINFDNRQIITIDYGFDKKLSEDNVKHEYETLLFEKIKNSYVFLNRLNDSQKVLACLKQNDKTQWQFLVETRAEYQGSTAWTEFKDNNFQTYYFIEEWMD